MTTETIKKQEASDAVMYNDLKSGNILVFERGGPDYYMCELGYFNVKNVKNVSVLDDEGASLWAFSLEGDSSASASATKKQVSKKPSPIKAVRALLRNADEAASSEAAKKEGVLTKAFKGMMALSPSRNVRTLRSASKEGSSEGTLKL